MVLPREFHDLESVAAPWALSCFNARYAKRLESNMDELQAFYDAVFPRATEIRDYCDRFDITDPPDNVKALLNVLYSLIAVSFAVEVWKQARVPDSGSAMFDAFEEPRV